MDLPIPSRSGAGFMMLPGWLTSDMLLVLATLLSTSVERGYLRRWFPRPRGFSSLPRSLHCGDAVLSPSWGEL
ncbi:hypothetical protein F5X68DRAFT_209136 [Plectosphaerella plurivora]|uniref:Uncharacterized protein n=1 Tax=Plectosphaerella plurivora TaxID=936078 RepID=A0A9P8VAG4_9PEZI|nr:hypothetical protein F5X68DRAFT_209136 [Plectosphaerella plurivora]